MCQCPDSITFKIPSWVNHFMMNPSIFANIDARMSFVVEAAKRNVMEQTGGPFAAAIFEKESGKLVSLGVNLVTSERLSMLHAEIVAITIAQRIAGTYDLGAEGLPPHELVTSSEPCAMCLGAVLWSGVSRLITGARNADARKIGFDDGPRSENWREALEERGIETIVDIQRDVAAAVLVDYATLGGTIYNSRASQIRGIL